MSWVAVAIGGSAILNYMGSQNANSAMSGATNQANQLAQSQYQQNRQDALPWMQRGNTAGNMLAYLMGLPGYGPRAGQPVQGVPRNQAPALGGGATLPAPNPITGKGDQMAFGVVNQMSPTEPGGIFDPASAPGQLGAGGAMAGPINQQYPMQGGDLAGGWDPSGMDPNAYGSLSRRFGASDFQADPGYEFRLSEGLKALQRSGAARGMALSGAQAKALTRYNSDFASNEYGNAYNRFTNDQTNLFNRLSGMAGTGQQANQFIGTMGANMANTVGGNLMNMGGGQAANYLSTANNLSGALNQGANMWQQNSLWQQLLKKGQ